MIIQFIHKARIGGIDYSYPDTLELSSNTGIMMIDQGLAIVVSDLGGQHRRLHSMVNESDHAPVLAADYNKIARTNPTTGKWELIAAPPSGSGTLNYIPKWTPNGTTLGNSQIFDDASYVGIGTASPSRRLDVNGAFRVRTLTEQTAYSYMLVADANGNVDYINKSTFLTAEADTLDSVTDRGATTTNGITIGSVKITTGATVGYYLSCTNVDGTAVWAVVSATDVYKGTWDASTNTPTLADGTGTSGWWYRCVVGGTVNFGAGNITFAAGDDVAYNGTIWQKRPGAAGYTLPTASTTVLGGVKIDGTTITISSGVISASPSAITVANEATDTTCFPLFHTAATGTLTPKTNSTYTYNSNTGLLSTTALAVNTYLASVKLKVNLSVDAGLSSRDVASESIVQFGNNLTTGYTGAIDQAKAGAMLRLDTRNTDGGDSSAKYTVIQFQTREAGDVEGLYKVPFQICPAPTGSFIMKRTGLMELNGGITTPITVISTLAVGTKPLTVTSTTMCTNLNADLLDGQHASAFAAASHTHSYDNYQKWQIAYWDGEATWTYTDITSLAKVRFKAGTGMTIGAPTWVTDRWEVEFASIGTGTVTSVAMTVPTGFSIGGSPITSSGTLALSMASGYAIPTTTEISTWNGYTNFWKRTSTLIETATANDTVKLSSNGSNGNTFNPIATGGNGTAIFAQATSTGYGQAIYAYSTDTANAIYSLSVSGYGVYAQSNGKAPLASASESTSTNTAISMFDIYRQTSGTAANGIGSKIVHFIENGSGFFPEAGSEGITLTGVTNGAENASYIWRLRNAGTVADAMVLTHLGGLTIASIRLTSGAGEDKVLTSDADGYATWQTPSAGSSNWNYTSNEYTPLGSGDNFYFNTTHDTAVAGNSSHESGIGVRGTGYYGVDGESSGGYGGYFYASSTAMPLYLQDASTNNLGFIKLIGGTAANFTESLSTVTGDGDVSAPKRATLGGTTMGWIFNGMMKINVNGSARWIPYYDYEQLS